MNTQRQHLRRFFTLAFGLSWLFWVPAAISGQDVMAFPMILLLIGGGAGPAVAEIILIFRAHDREQRRDYWQRIFDIHRIGGRWQAVIWLTFPMLNISAILLCGLTGGGWPTFETIKHLLAAPWMLIPFASSILLFGPLPEELGWRGYALDGLQTRWNALTSSLILGMMWAGWHLPLFFMNGTFQHDQLGFGTLNFWSFCTGAIVSSILFTWVYNNTHRSTLSAILFHFMLNFSGELLAPTDRARFYQLLLLTATAIIVVVIWGPETLTQERGSSASLTFLVNRLEQHRVPPARKGQQSRQEDRE